MRMGEIPALLTVPAAAELLVLPVLEIEMAIRFGQLPTVRLDGIDYVPARVLLLEMGVPPDHPELPAAIDPVRVRLAG